MTFKELVINLWNKGYSVKEIIESVGGDREEVECIVENPDNYKEVK